MHLPSIYIAGLYEASHFVRLVTHYMAQMSQMIHPRVFCVYVYLEPGRVNLLTVDTMSSANSLGWSWQPSSANNCHGTEYEIQYSLINKDQCQMVDEQDAEWRTLRRTTDTFITIESLLPHTTYKVSVRAFNDAGLGATSFDLQTTMQTGTSFSN